MFSAAAQTPQLWLPMLVIGLVLALLGWVLYWGGLTAVGAALGAAFGSGLGAVLAHIFGWSVSASTVTAVCGGILGAILGAMALRAFHTIVFFVGGVLLGSLATQQGLVLAHHLQWTWTEGATAEIIIRTLGALIGGVLCVVFSKFIIVIVTSTLGTLLIVASWPTNLMFAFAIPIWVVSTLLQYSIARRLNLFSKVQRRQKE